MDEVEQVETTTKEVVEIVGAAVEEMINSLFEYIVAPYSAEEMNVLIEEDTTVLDMVRYLFLQVKQGKAASWSKAAQDRWNRVVEMLAAARKIAAKVGKPMIQKYFNYDNAMKVFKERRPDLYERFSREDGKAWLEKNLQEIADFLTR